MAWHRFTLTDPALGWTVELDRALERALGLRRFSAPSARLKLGMAFHFDGQPDARACRALGGLLQEVDGPPPAWGHQDRLFQAAWDRYRAALADLAPEALAHLNPPASSDDVDVLWAQSELPSPLLALLALHDGEKDHVGGGVFPIWRPLSAAQMLDSKRFLDELHADPGTCDADLGVHRMWWHPGWWPWATNGGGDYLVLDLDPAPGGKHGQVLYFDHAGDYRERIADSLTDAVQQLVDDLADGTVVALEDEQGAFWTLAELESMAPVDLEGLTVRQ